RAGRARYPSCLATRCTCTTRPTRLTCPVRPHPPYTGFVFRGGLKNGVFTTTAGTRWRTASTVTSNSSAVPSAAYGLATVARAINFFNIGDHVVVVARPTCRPPRYTGTATREAV